MTDLDRLVRALKAGDRVDELLLAVQGDLNLYYRHIGNLGAMSLAGLKTNSTIISLDLGGCEIGTEGLVPLANALSLNTTITKVLLGNNSIDDDGAAVLAEVCVCARTYSLKAYLLYVFLRFNHCTDSDMYPFTTAGHGAQHTHHAPRSQRQQDQRSWIVRPDAGAGVQLDRDASRHWWQCIRGKFL